MTQQTQAIQLFAMVKEQAIVKVLCKGMKQYTWEEDGWKYDFFTDHDKLVKVEAYNHRELIEVYIH